MSRPGTMMWLPQEGIFAVTGLLRNWVKNRWNNNQEGGTPQNSAPRELAPPEPVDGLLEITNKGFGFLRKPDNDFDAFPEGACDVSVRRIEFQRFFRRGGMHEEQEEHDAQGRQGDDSQRNIFS